MFIKQHIRLTLVSIFAVLVLLLSNLGIGNVGAGQATNLFSGGVFSVKAAPFCDPIVNFGSSHFSNPTNIKNKWLPLVPGTQLTLEGTTSQGIHRVVFTVTDRTKMIDGVRTLVIWDRDFNGNELAEAELAFFAQDDAGNVWNLGEYPEEYEGGQFAGAPNTWIAGVAGAEGGIHMLAEPKTGTGHYLQGISLDINFLDCAKVFKMGQSICVPVDCYQNVLETSETSPLEQGGGYQTKYHASGIGIVQIGAVGDPEAETLVLVKRVRLSGNALTQADNAAIKLDIHGCQVSDVYSQTC